MRNIITATEGHVLTNGTVYGKKLFLSASADPGEFYEITDAEYQAIMEAQPDENEKMIPLSDLESAYREGVNSI